MRAQPLRKSYALRCVRERAHPFNLAIATPSRAS